MPLFVEKKILPDKFAIACSGGTDSVALAFYLRRLKPTILHFNHKLLPEDDFFEEKTRKFAEHLGLDFLSSSSLEKYSKGSVEAWCREQRYEWFSTLGFNICTAHTLSDCIESYILKTFAGTPHYDPIPVFSQFGQSKIIRPMMLSSKSDVDAFLKFNNLIQWTTQDPLNDDQSKMRNWVRHKLLPLIATRKEVNLKTTVKKIVRKQYEKHLTIENPEL